MVAPPTNILNYNHFSLGSQSDDTCFYTISIAGTRKTVDMWKMDYSDDDLPNLADIFDKQRPRASIQIRHKMVKDSGRDKKLLEERQLSTQREHFSNTNENSGGESQSGGEAQKPKPRRRVLNKKCDNPLLRPLTSSTQSKATCSLRLSPPLKPRTTSERQLKSTRGLVNAKSRVPTFVEVENCASSGFDSMGLSDFIVSDSSFLDEEDSDNKSLPPPARSTRKLVRGRRPLLASPTGSHSSPDELRAPERDACGPFMAQRSRNDTDFFVGPKGMGINAKSTSKDHVGAKLNRENACTGLEDPFALLSFSPSVKPSSEKTTEGTLLQTPPPSPQKTKKTLLSPKKTCRIPPTPHRPSMDAFWSQEFINEWNDEFSPRKTLKPKPRMEGPLPSGSSCEKKQSDETKTTLKTKKAFGKEKHQIAEKFLQELDEVITQGRISQLAASTGGISIVWSKKLNTTAGRANWKRETMRSNTKNSNGEPITTTTYRHHASIELAEKVIDDEDRLLNVIAHEFCHLANFMISDIRNNPHGKQFRAWASKCSQQFGHRGINVTTKHSYFIDYKYIWECTNCGVEFKRHSKSLDPLRHQCGSCKSKLVQVKPAPRANVVVNAYQVFVKENMKKLKDDNPGSPQKDIMGLMGKMYQKHKASKLEGNGPRWDLVTGKIKESAQFTEQSPGNVSIDSVARRLDFLDLTSP